MTPGLLVRVLGYWPITFTLLGFYTGILCGWYMGYFPFLIAAGAVYAARKTMNAYDQKREFMDGQRLLKTDPEDLGKLPPPSRPYAELTLRLFPLCF